MNNLGRYALSGVFVFAHHVLLAAGVNALPSLESFETYPGGASIDSVSGWSASAGAGTITTNAAILEQEEIYVLDGGTLPIDTSHARVLHIGGDVEQSVTGLPGDTVQTDFMLYPVRRNEAPALNEDHQCGLVFNSNGVAQIWHHDVHTTNNVWIVLTNAPALSTHVWTRVTFLQNYAHNAYQLRLDQGAPISDGRGWSDATTNAVHPGAWYRMPGTNKYMSAISFTDNGDAYVDDLIVGGELPSVLTGAASISGGAGTLSGQLEWAGLSDTAIVAYWGLSDGGADPAAWGITNTLAAPVGVGHFTIPINGVSSDVTNYFRFAAINAAGTNWVSASTPFIWLEFAPPSFAETNFVPFAESFEYLDLGYSIDDAWGWFMGATADEDTGHVTADMTAVLALTNYIAGGGTYPLNTTHDRILSLGGVVSLSIASPLHEPVRTDMLLRPVFADERPELGAGHQLGLIFNTDGVAEIFHSNILTGSNEWITLENAPVITTQSWTRVTFHQDYSNNMYQVSINESAPITHANGWTGGGAPGGSWFRMPNARGHMLELTFGGSGQAYLDDVVIAGKLPLVDSLPASNVVAGAADLNGFLSITGAASTAVSVYYGLSDGGTDAAAWDATNTFIGEPAPGVLSSHVSGLDTNRLYFYRYAAMNAFGANWADSSEVFFPGVVSMGPALDGVNESPPTSIDVTVTRPSTATNADLTVYINVAGTATNGEDYQHVRDNIVIPAGAVNASFSVTAVRDLLLEGPEQADFTLTGETHASGAANATTVVITDGPADGENLVWNNGDGDRNWNNSSLNWIPGALNFLDGDSVEFSGLAPGRIYVGDATFANPGFSAASAVQVVPKHIKVTAGTYEFEGGAIGADTVWISGGALTDRRLSELGLGYGPVVLQGGEFWRQIPPGTATRNSVFTNDIIVESASKLVGNRGNNNWLGRLELKDALVVSHLDTESTAHNHSFAGDVVINQDTNFPGERLIDVHGQYGETTLSGNISDSSNATHTATWPLKIGSRQFFNTVYAGEIYISGSNNSYSNGTVIAAWPGQVNRNNGVTVSLGSQLGHGPVTVQNQARLTLLGLDSIRNSSALYLEGGAEVILPNSNHVERVIDMHIGGSSVGFGIFGASDYPFTISGLGKIEVFREMDALMLIIR